MTKYIIQYSVPTDKKIAISDWLERKISIMADNLKDARLKANNKLQNIGTWMILDIYPE